jgi:Type II secretion system (T2SS), protein K
VKSGSQLLHGSLAPNQSFEARITGEGGRLNLNAIAGAVIANPNSPARELLRKYLEIKGVDLNERDHMIDCLLDWIDPDNLVRLNGAEDDQGYQPTNGPLKTLDEVKRIRGWEEFASQPDWDADFTLNSVNQGNQAQSAQIDINSASRDVLLSLPGFAEPIVDRLLQLRRGPDNIEGTEDDYQLTANDVQSVGVRLDQIPQLTGLIAYDSAVKRVVSVGKSGSTTRTVRMVLLKINNGSSRLISWKEL